MELLEAVESLSFTKIKALINSNNISLGKDSLSSRVLMRAFAYERKDVIRFLLKSYCFADTVMETYAFKTTPLHCAVKLRDVDLIKEILQMDPSVEAADSDGNSALHLAFLHKHEVAIDLILAHIEHRSKFVNAMNKNGLTHMHIACTRRNTNVINGFLKGKVDLKDSVSNDSPHWAGYTALHFAAEFGSLEAFRLIQHAESEIDNSNRKTPWQLVREHLQNLLVMSFFCKDKDSDDRVDSETYFILACLRKDLNLLKKFIANGINLNYYFFTSKLNTFRDSALHFAVKSGHKATVELLLQHGADLRSRNSYLMTPLHWALYNDHSKKSEIVDLLYKFEENIDVNIEDENGLGHFQVAVTRNDLEVVKKFLADGVDVNKLIKPNSSGFSHFTPLHFAVLYQHTEMAKLLIKRGANVDLFGQENSNGSPLHLAFHIGHKDLIELLLSSAANAKLIKANGETMLHSLVPNFVIEDNSQQSLLSSDKQAILMYVEQLIKLGVDVNAQDKDGWTALHYLRLEDGKCAPCFQLLLELGADINLVSVQGSLPLDIDYYEESRCDSAEYLIFYHHVQKLKTLGLEVHPANDRVCKLILDGLKALELDGKSSRTEELACRQRQRLDEVARLKNIMITSFMSLYHFLKLEPIRAATYVPNDVLEEILTQKDFDKTYPSYGYLIRLQYKRHSSSRANNFEKKIVCSEVDEVSPPSKRQRSE